MEASLRICAKAAALLFFSVSLAQAAAPATVPERLRDAIAHIAPQLRPELHKDGGIEIHGGPKSAGTVYADNVEKACAQQPDHCDEAIQRFATSITSAITETGDVAPTGSNVFPVVRSAGLMRSMSEAAHGDPEKSLVSQAFTADSVVLYAIDTPNAMRFASAQDLKKQGISAERLQAMAVANIGRLAPVKVNAMPDSNGLVAMIAQDGYATSRLFGPEFIKELEQAAGGPVVVAVPTRDWILAVKADDTAAVHKLRDVAARIVRGEPYSVTADLVRWDGKTWQPVPP